MQRLHGRSACPGRALGTARVVRTFADLLMISPPARPRPFWLGDSPDVEGVEVVCVLLGDSDLRAEDLPSCAVAVVTEGPWLDAAHPSQPRHLPAVVEVGPRLRLVKDGDLLLVDGDQGLVAVDPTDRVVAAFQAHALGIMPQRRLFLEYSHQPVRLPDGRQIRVGASVGGPAAIAGALDNGPDSLFFQTGDPEDIHLAVRDAHGKPVTFSVHPEGGCEEALAEAALLGDVTAVLPASLAEHCFGAFRETVEAASLLLAEEGCDLGHLRYGLLMQQNLSNPAHALTSGVERVVASIAEAPLDQGWLEAVLEAARSVVVPVEVIVGAAGRLDPEEVIDLGINGIIVPPSEVQRWKETLRNVFAMV